MLWFELICFFGLIKLNKRTYSYRIIYFVNIIILSTYPSEIQIKLVLVCYEIFLKWYCWSCFNVIFRMNIQPVTCCPICYYKSFLLRIPFAQYKNANWILSYMTESLKQNIFFNLCIFSVRISNAKTYISTLLTKLKLKHDYFKKRFI